MGTGNQVSQSSVRKTYQAPEIGSVRGCSQIPLGGTQKEVAD